jgi:hypothetical protein
MSLSPRLLARGKNGKVVVCAVMRKLVHLIVSVLKSGRPFDPAICTENLFTGRTVSATVDCWRFSEMNYYQVKEMMTVKLRGADDLRRTPLQRTVRLPSVVVASLYFPRFDVTIVRVFPRSGFRDASTHSAGMV